MHAAAASRDRAPFGYEPSSGLECMAARIVEMWCYALLARVYYTPVVKPS